MTAKKRNRNRKPAAKKPAAKKPVETSPPPADATAGAGTETAPRVADAKAAKPKAAKRTRPIGSFDPVPRGQTGTPQKGHGLTEGEVASRDLYLEDGKVVNSVKAGSGRDTFLLIREGQVATAQTFDRIERGF